MAAEDQDHEPDPVDDDELVVARQAQAYSEFQVAFHNNTVCPCLRHSVALIKAWNYFARLYGVE